MVVEEQTQAHHPGRPQRRDMGQDEGQRPDDMRRHLQQHFALDQRFAHQAELVVFQVAQPAMDQLGAGGGGGAGEVRLLGKHDLEPSARGVTGDAGAIDAAAHHEQIDQSGRVRLEQTSCPPRYPPVLLEMSGADCPRPPALSPELPPAFTATVGQGVHFHKRNFICSICAKTKMKRCYRRAAAGGGIAAGASASAVSANSSTMCSTTPCSAILATIEAGGRRSVKRASMSCRLPSRTMARRPNLVWSVTRKIWRELAMMQREARTSR